MIIMWAFAALVAASAAAASRDDGRENAGERAAAALVDGLSPLEAALLRAVAQMGAALDETDQRLAAFLSFDGGGELLASLDATMALLKGEVLALTAFALKQHLAAAIETCTDDPEASFTLFKEAHLVIKRLVVGLVGEQGAKTRWALEPARLDRVPQGRLLQLLKQMRLLVIAYDNLTPLQKRTLTTAIEVVKNRDWLIEMARRGLEVERAQLLRLHGIRTYDPASGKRRPLQGLSADVRAGRCREVTSAGDTVMRAANRRFDVHKELVDDAQRWAPIPSSSSRARPNLKRAGQQQPPSLR